MRRGFRFPKWATRSERRTAKARQGILRPSPYHRRLMCEELEDRRLLNATAAAFPATGTAAAPSNWTVLVYLDGDNSLESWAKMNVEQMEQVGSTSDVKIVAQFDRGSQSTQNSYGNFFPSWYGCRRGDHQRPQRPWPGIFFVVRIHGDVDMGSSATLTNFIQWAVTNYPANHYLLDLWDHGDGIGGVCEDDSSDSMLSLSDVRQAIASAGTHMDVIGFDACLMAMTETADEIQSSGDVMVASEEIIPAAGWPYNTWLADLSAHAGWTASQVGRTSSRIMTPTMTRMNPILPSVPSTWPASRPWPRASVVLPWPPRTVRNGRRSAPLGKFPRTMTGKIILTWGPSCNT